MFNNKLSQDEISALGEFDINVQKYLQQFKVHQDDELHHSDAFFWGFINRLEQVVFQYADKLSNGFYAGGLWKMDDGYFELCSNSAFTVDSPNGTTATLNAREFSIVVNLFALSEIAILTYSNKNIAVNQLAVFLSDYLKALMRKNKTQVDISNIISLIN